MNEETILKYEKGKELYLQGKTLNQIKYELQLDPGKLSKYLKLNGVKIERLPHKKKINKNIFEVINTEEKAYWLGFLYADGYVGLTDNRVELTLQLSDVNHIKKFKTFLNSDCKISTNSYRSRLSIKDEKIKKDLINLGCTPQKSLTLKFPTDDKIPKELIRHFIRGYFDGDGSLCVTEKTKSIDILGTYDFLYQLCLESNIATSKIYVSKSKSNKVFRIVLGSRLDLYNFSKYIYDDCNIYLDRKYGKFKKLMEYYN